MSHTKELVIDIYSDISTKPGAALKELLRQSIRNRTAFDRLLVQFPGAKISLLSSSGDILKVAIVYQSGDPDTIGRSALEGIGSLVGGALMGILGRIAGAALGNEIWSELKTSGKQNWVLTNLLGVTNLGLKVSESRSAINESPVPTRQSAQLHFVPGESLESIEIARTVPNGFEWSTGFISHDPDAPITENSYMVSAGDSLCKIAALNGLSLEALLDANPQITHPDLIHLGQIINLPALSKIVDTSPVTPRTGGESSRVESQTKGTEASRVTQGTILPGQNATCQATCLDASGLNTDSAASAVLPAEAATHIEADFLRSGNHHSAPAVNNGEAGTQSYEFAALTMLNTHLDNVLFMAQTAWSRLHVWINIDDDYLQKTFAELGVPRTDLPPTLVCGAYLRQWVINPPCLLQHFNEYQIETPQPPKTPGICRRRRRPGPKCRN